MSSSAARIAANQANAQKSTGPKTAEGKEASRGNGYKHGLTGLGIVKAEAEAAQVADLARRLRADSMPVTELGRCLIDQMAILHVRTIRCEEEGRARRAAMNEGDGGLFDASPEGKLLQRYEQAATRNFHKAHAIYRKAEAEARSNGGGKPLPPVPPTPMVRPAPAATVGSSFPVLEPLPTFAEEFPELAEIAYLIDGSMPPLQPKPSFAPTRMPSSPMSNHESKPLASGWSPDFDR